MHSHKRLLVITVTINMNIANITNNSNPITVACGDDDANAVDDRGPYEYELWLRTDLYTEKHTQWYYFMVTNTQPNITYRFTIVNFMKVCICLSFIFVSYS